MQGLQTIEDKSIAAIRFLAADAAEKAKSGHPGMPMGAAATAYTLWMRHLKHNPAAPRGRIETASSCPPGTHRCCCTPCSI